MKHFIETKVIHHTKSDLLIDIIKHESGKNYLEIIQTFHDEKQNTSIKVNPIILNQLIESLQEIQQEHFSTIDISETEKEKIISNYLKGASTEGLSLLINKSKKFIEEVLTQNGIVLAENNPPKRKKD